MGVGYISVNIDMGTKLRELSGTNQKISSGNFKISSTWESIKILLLLEHYQLMVVICSLALTGNPAKY